MSDGEICKVDVDIMDATDCAKIVKEFEDLKVFDVIPRIVCTIGIVTSYEVVTPAATGEKDGAVVLHDVSESKNPLPNTPASTY